MVVAEYLFFPYVTNFDSEMLMLTFPGLAGLTLHLLKAVLLIKDKFPPHKP